MYRRRKFLRDGYIASLKRAYAFPDAVNMYSAITKRVPSFKFTEGHLIDAPMLTVLDTRRLRYPMDDCRV